MKHEIVLYGVRITAEVVDRKAFNKYKNTEVRDIFENDDWSTMVYTLEQAEAGRIKMLLCDDTIEAPVKDIPYYLACMELEQKVVDDFKSGKRKGDNVAFVSQQFQRMEEAQYYKDITEMMDGEE